MEPIYIPRALNTRTYINHLERRARLNADNTIIILVETTDHAAFEIFFDGCAEDFQGKVNCKWRSPSWNHRNKGFREELYAPLPKKKEKKKEAETELTAGVLKKKKKKRRKKKRSKTHMRLIARFLIRRNRSKRAHFRGKPLFQATYNNTTENS